MDLKRVRESYANLADWQILHIYQNEFNSLERDAQELLLQEIQKRRIDRESTPEPPSTQEKIFAVGSSHPLRYFVYYGWIWGLLQISTAFISFKTPELPFRMATALLSIIWIVAAVGVGKLQRWGYTLALTTASLEIAYHLILTIPFAAREISRRFFSGKMEFIGFPPQVSLVVWVFWMIYLLRPKTRNMFKK